MGSWTKQEIGLCDYCGSEKTVYRAYNSSICSRCAWIIGQDHIRMLEEWLVELNEKIRKAREKKGD